MGRKLVDARAVEALAEAFDQAELSGTSEPQQAKMWVKCGRRPSLKEDRHPAGL